MPDTVQCDAHGKTPQTFVCVHLKDDATALGFNREEPSEENPYPDAWCDECAPELVREITLREIRAEQV
jgi:hypothetical protein